MVDHIYGFYYEFYFSFSAPATSKSTSGLTDITWSSSGSDLSDEDKIIFESQSDNEHGSGTYRLCGRNILCPEDQTNDGKLIL